MMKNKMFKSLAVLMMLAMFNFISFAQSSRERVQFAKGKSSITLKRTLGGNAGAITFILYVKKGQMMNFTVDSTADLGISLDEKGSQDYILQSEPGEPNEHEVAKTGDHYITVVNRSNKKASLTLTVVIK